MTASPRSPGQPRASSIGHLSGLRSSRYGIYVLCLFTAANLLHYGNRNVLFSMYEDLRQQFGFTNSELGLLGTAFMLSHALATPLVGWAGDRFDRRRIIALGLVLWSSAAIVSGFASGFGTFFLGRALVGVGTAACVPLCNSILCEVFPEGQKARTVAIFNVGLFIGGAAGFGVGRLGYPVGVLAMAAPGLIAAFFVARLDVQARRASNEASMAFHDFLAQARQLASVPTMRWVLCGAVTMAFSAGGYQAWLFDFLQKGKRLAPGTTYMVLGIALLGGLFGVLCGGAVGDRLQRRLAYGRLAAISAGMMTSVPFALACIYLDDGIAFYIASGLTMFFIMWYHGPMAAVVDDLAIDDRAVTAQAVVFFTMHLLGTAPSPWVIGKIADAYGLERAMLVPSIGVLAAGFVFMGGWRSMARDRVMAASASGQSGLRAL